jgi:hypothetical protein
LTTPGILGVRCPASPRLTASVPHEVKVEAQLRDLAILLLIALLFVLTIQALRLTQDHTDDGRRR